MKGVRMRQKSVFILLGLIFTMAMMTYTVSAQDGAMIGGLGVGNFPGLEVGINLDAVAQIRAEASTGVYDRACTAEEHDPYRWHPLVNTELKCHYNHHHGDDPNYVNDIFGAPGEWFGVNHQSLSYPWQTFPTDDRYASPESAAAAGMMENQMKHEGYMWIVRRNQPCPNQGEGCTTDFRLQLKRERAGIPIVMKGVSAGMPMTRTPAGLSGWVGGPTSAACS
jgi:hypothetical protein